MWRQQLNLYLLMRFFQLPCDVTVAWSVDEGLVQIRHRDDTRWHSSMCRSKDFINPDGTLHESVIELEKDPYEKLS